MPTRWFTTDDSEIPTPVECELIGYPHRDALGRTQYDNTHYDSEREAWVRGRASVDAAVSLGERLLDKAEEQVVKARIGLDRDRERRLMFRAARGQRFTRLIVDAEEAIDRLRVGSIYILDVHPAVFELLVRRGYVHRERDAAGMLVPVADALDHVEFDPVRDITDLARTWTGIRAALLAWADTQPADFYLAYDLRLFGLVDDEWRLTALARDHVIPALKVIRGESP